MMRVFSWLFAALVLWGTFPSAEAAPKRKRARSAKVSKAQRARAAAGKPRKVEAPPTVAAAEPPRSRGPTRIDFDDRLIQGQGNSAGAVYLYDRKELPLTPLVKQRSTFLPEVLSSVFGHDTSRARSSR